MLSLMLSYLLSINVNKVKRKDQALTGKAGITLEIRHFHGNAVLTNQTGTV